VTYSCHCGANKVTSPAPGPEPETVFATSGGGQGPTWYEETHSIKACFRYSAVSQIMQLKSAS
jgi:hypothetical protein